MSEHNLWGMDLFINGNNNNIYNNNFINNTNLPQIRVVSSTSNKFNLAPPIGGNYWSDYDEPGEGCNDVIPADGFCDQPYVFAGGQDALPLTTPYFFDSNGDGVDRAIDELINDVQALGLPKSLDNALVRRLKYSQKLLAQGYAPRVPAVVLEVFNLQVNAQSGRKIDPIDAAALVADAELIIRALRGGANR
jgi:hypothetical protein